MRKSLVFLMIAACGGAKAPAPAAPDVVMVKAREPPNWSCTGVP